MKKLRKQRDKLTAIALDGNIGSNLLALLASALVAGHIDWTHVFVSPVEQGKLVGIIVVAFYGFLVGKPPRPNGHA